MKNRPEHTNVNVFISMAFALAILVIFTGWNYFLHEQALLKKPVQIETGGRESIPDPDGMAAFRMIYSDFESGNASDPASHLANTGHRGKQSLKMSSEVPFSPGLWIKFKDLNPGDSSWIRVTGFIWFSCLPAEAKCSLVATCNHKGVNFKYMFVSLENENLKPNQWNRVSLDYHIPPAPDREDVLQAYFWYRGSGEILVDDIDIVYYTAIKK